MRTRTLAAASLLLVIGAWLRLHGLQAMEFKADERESLELAIQFINNHPWSSAAPWPSHGLISSNGVGNAPLFTWIVAAFWTLTHHPVGVTALIAVINTLCLVPLWLWAQRRMDEHRALLTLAIAAVSPFAVLFSRKIWPVDLLLPGLLALLWSIEWLREGRVWLAAALAGFGILLITQLHQSGVITAPLLLVAFVMQSRLDRRVTVSHIPRPTAGELAAIAIAVAANAFFWWTYLPYLITVPADVYAKRPIVNSFEPQLFLNVLWQIVPRDVLAPFSGERVLFRADLIRWTLYYASLALGAPLAVYGVWRWLRSPLTLPISGIWWWLVVVAFALARIPSYPYYVLAVMPLPVILASGAFDGALPALWARAASMWRWVYVVILLALTIVTSDWLASRGGSLDDFGVTFEVQEAQARSLLRRLRGERPVLNHERGEIDMSDTLIAGCHPVTREVRWIAGWLEGRSMPTFEHLQMCHSWPVDERQGYQWAIREAP
jgi:hypothetical protein